MKSKILEEGINDFSFFRCASFSLPIKIADVERNKKLILKAVDEASSISCNFAMFQPLVLTSSSCASLFFDSFFLEKSLFALFDIMQKTRDKNLIICVGFPLQHAGSIYNAIALLYQGKILAINALSPTSNMQKFFSNYAGNHQRKITLFDAEVIFGNNIVLNVVLPNTRCIKLAFSSENDYELFYRCDAHINCVFSCESTYLKCREKILNRCKTFSQSPINSTFDFISSNCKKAIIFASPSDSENYYNALYSNFTCIIEAGEILSSSDALTPMKNNDVPSSFSYADIDIELLGRMRNRNNYERSNISFNTDTITEISLKFTACNIAPISSLVRPLSKHPFMPRHKQELESYIKEIFELEAIAIQKKLTSTGIEKVVLGISGGIDSSIALLFLTRAFRISKIDVQNIHAFTLPCFGTTEGTKTNALNLCKLVGCSIEEINIKQAVLEHFKDIKQDVNCYDVTFENAQARHRTQVLMNKANQLNALVIGSSDLSEIALGFSTFAGDHISMYNILASLPKTILRLCLEYAGKHSQLFLQEEMGNPAIDDEIKHTEKADKFSACISSILEIPISPELLPHQDGKITQKTEEILGSYELQDFFIHHICQHHYSPKKTYALALLAFSEYKSDEILEKLKLFYKRFIMSQFKRNCSPESPNITGYALSNWEMPSNTSAKLYVEELESLKI